MFHKSKLLIAYFNNKVMMYKLLILFFISIANGCNVEKLQCEDLKVRTACLSSNKYYTECGWDS